MGQLAGRTALCAPCCAWWLVWGCAVQQRHSGATELCFQETCRMPGVHLCPVILAHAASGGLQCTLGLQLGSLHMLHKMLYLAYSF
jgi:hypothetical protein